MPYRPRISSFFYFLIAIVVVTVIPFAALFQTRVQADNPFGPTVIANIKVGGGGYSPWGLAVNTATNRVYAANDTSNNVSVFDGSTNNFIATVAAGTNPEGVAVNSTTNKIYVANNSSNDVTVIDGATNTVAATISVGVHPLYVAANPISNQVYVANTNSNTVSQINGNTNTVVATINVGTTPEGLALNPAANRMYVANYDANTVSVIDTNSNSVVATVNVGTHPTDVTINATTNLIYVANYSSGTVSVIDGSTNTVTAAINTSVSPRALAVNSTTNRIYTANDSASTLSVIDGSTNSIIAAAGVPVSSHGLAVNAASNRIYVSNYSTNSLTVIEGSNNNAIIAVSTGTQPIAAAVNATTNKIYVANDSGGTISVIDGSNSNLTSTINVGINPQAAAVNATTNRIYAANYGGNMVSVINGSTNAVIATVTVGNGPRAISANAVTNKIYSANYNSNTVSVIDGVSNAVTATVNVGVHPKDVAVNTTTNKIYVANYDSNTVSVIDGVSNSVVATINNTGSGTAGVAVNTANNRVYLANNNSNTVSVVDGATNLVTATVNVGAYPVKVAVNQVTNRIYVSNLNANTVSVIDGASNNVTATVSVGSWPEGLSINSSTNRIYVANYHSDTVSVIQDSTASTTSLVSSANPSDFGQPLTLTATVIVSGGTPTGTVTFNDGAAALGSAPLVSGQATYFTSTLITGSHALTAAYSGDSNFSASTGSLNQNVIHITFPDPNLNTAIRQVISKPSGDIYQFDLVNLTTLTAENKGISNLSGLEYCTNLQTLDLNNNQISSISSLSGLMKLQTLELNSNQINNLSALSNLFSLRYLELNSNQVSNLSTLSYLTGLTYLNLDNNQIGNISALSNMNLQDLYLSNNQINSLSGLANMSNLQELDLGYNRISDISNLSNLTKLQFLAMQNNQIIDLSALTNLTRLANLHLDTNAITSISALVANFGLGAGDNISLAHNYLRINTASQNMTDIQTLIGRGANVAFQPQDTQVIITSSANPSTYGQSVNFTATVSPLPDGGTIQFTDGGTSLGSPINVDTASGQAVYSASSVSTGIHSIAAAYSGDASFTSSTASLTQTVNKATPVITWGTPADIAYGTALSATQLNGTCPIPGNLVYTPAAGTIPNAATFLPLNVAFTPTDTLNYFNASASVNINVTKVALTVTAADKTMVFSQPLPAFTAAYSGFVNGDNQSALSGSASLTTTAGAASPVGSYPITVSQGALHAANYSFNFVNGTLSITQASTTAALSASSNPANFGQPLTFTATIHSVAPAAGVPAGPVDFSEGGASLGTGTIDSAGKATFVSSDLSLGTHLITAVYAGDANFAGSIGNIIVNVATSVNLIIHGSDSAGALMTTAQTQFNAAGLGTTIGSLVVNSSDAGISDLLNGTNGGANIAMSSRPLTTSEAQTLTAYSVARVGLLFIVSNNVPVDITQLTEAQIKGIYEGTYTDWNQVGSSTSMPIMVRAQNLGSDIRNFLLNKLNIIDVTEQATVSASTNVRLDTNSQMQAAINDATDGAAGYVDTGYGKDSTHPNMREIAIVNPANGQAFSPSPLNIYSGHYPLTRFLSLVIKTSGDGMHDNEMILINWMQQLDGPGQSIVNSSGLLLMVPNQDVTHDNAIDVSDLVQVGNHIGENGLPHWIRADVTSDGHVDVSDMVQVGNWVGVNIITGN